MEAGATTGGVGVWVADGEAGGVILAGVLRLGLGVAFGEDFREADGEGGLGVEVLGGEGEAVPALFTTTVPAIESPGIVERYENVPVCSKV